MDNIPLFLLISTITAVCVKDTSLVLCIIAIFVVVYYMFFMNNEQFADVTPPNSLPDVAAVKAAPAASETVFDNSSIINNVFANSSKALKQPQLHDGDDLLSSHMKSVSGMAKEAMLNRTRFTSDNFRPYFQEELDEQEHSRAWWDADNLDDQMVKDGHQY